MAKQKNQATHFAPVLAGIRRSVSWRMRCSENGSSSRNDAKSAAATTTEKRRVENDDDIEGNMYFWSMKTRTEITTEKKVNAERTKSNFIRTNLPTTFMSVRLQRRTGIFTGDPLIYGSVAVAFICFCLCVPVCARCVHLLFLLSCTMCFWPWETFRNCNLKNSLLWEIAKYLLELLSEK